MGENVKSHVQSEKRCGWVGKYNRLIVIVVLVLPGMQGTATFLKPFLIPLFLASSARFWVLIENPLSSLIICGMKTWSSIALSEVHIAKISIGALTLAGSEVFFPSGWRTFILY